MTIFLSEKVEGVAVDFRPLLTQLISSELIVTGWIISDAIASTPESVTDV